MIGCKNQVVAPAVKNGAGLYHLVVITTSNHLVNTAMESRELLWHQRFWHIGEANLKMTSERLVDGFNYTV